MRTNPELSIVIPIYNSAPFIEERYQTLTSIVAGVTEHYEILFCNDASPDNSQDILKSIARQDEKVRLLRNTINRGLGFSFKKMVKAASGDIIVATDIDLSFDVTRLGELKAMMEDHDVVVASRYAGIDSRIPLARRLVSRSYWLLCKLLFSIPIADMGSGFFLVRREAMNRVDLEADRFGFHCDIHSKLSRLGCRFVEVPVRYDHDIGPDSTFKVLRHAWPTFLETLRIWWGS